MEFCGTMAKYGQRVPGSFNSLIHIAVHVVMYIMKQFWLPLQLCYDEVLLYNQVMYFFTSLNWQQLK